LTIAGDGPLRGMVEQQIGRLGLAGSVRLLGYRGRDQVAQLMREECDLLVLASRSETFGVVLIEALACGKPVVATRCGGPESIVTDPALGLLCEVDDPGSLSQALGSAIQRLPQYSPATIRRFACDRFDYRHLAGKLAAAYRDVLDKEQEWAEPPRLRQCS
jgi:glycosyltransferase involved in cell wall biosynthesis